MLLITPGKGSGYIPWKLGPRMSCCRFSSNLAIRRVFDCSIFCIRMEALNWLLKGYYYITQVLYHDSVNTSHTPRDAPEMMNSIFEQRTIKEKTLCLLIKSSLPVAFWWDAPRTAVYIINRMQTRTAQGTWHPLKSSRDDHLLLSLGLQDLHLEARRWQCKEYKRRCMIWTW